MEKNGIGVRGGYYLRMGWLKKDAEKGQCENENQ